MAVPEKTDKYKAEHTICINNAELNYHLLRFGDHLAEREGYKDLSGIDAVHYYLIQKHHWTPAQVRGMSSGDLRFLLSGEMQGWTLPKEAVV